MHLGPGHPVMCTYQGSESHLGLYYQVVFGGLETEDSKNGGQDWGDLGLKDLGPG